MSKQAILYTTDWCPYCRQAKKYLEKNSIEVIEKDIEEDDSIREELLSKTNGVFSGVPVIDIDGKILEGFDKKEIDRALEI
jgi:glutaredoxin-like YruB-family protein